MALADEFMKSEEPDTEVEAAGSDLETFKGFRQKFLTGTDEEAYDAFEGMVALCESGDEETEPEAKPPLRSMMGASEE